MAIRQDRWRSKAAVISAVSKITELDFNVYETEKSFSITTSTKKKPFALNKAYGSMKALKNWFES